MAGARAPTSTVGSTELPTTEYGTQVLDLASKARRHKDWRRRTRSAPTAP